MDQIITFLTRRNIIALLILAVLAVGLVVGVRLVQQQTQLKSKATTACEDQRDPNCSGDDLYCWCRGCTILQQGCTFIHYEPGGWLCKSSGDICSGNAVEYVPSGADCSAVTQCAAQSPPPAGPQPVTVSGKVVNKVTNQGVQVTINQGVPNDCNIGTRQTNSSGVYSFNNVTPKAGTFCLRIGPVSGYKGVETTSGQGSYEDLAANSSSNRDNYNFYLIPDDDARPSVFKITDGSNKDVTAGPLITGNSYTVEIRMVNNGNSVWEKGVYKLQPVGETKSTWSLNQSYDWISPSGNVSPGGEAVFSISSKAPANPVGPPGAAYDMGMTNSQKDFGAGIQRLLQVQAAGGPGPTGTFDFDLEISDSDIEITRGSSDTIGVEVTADESNPRSINIDLSVSDFPSGVDGKFSSESCNSLRAGRTCTRTLTIEADSRASIVTRRNITVTATSDAQSGRVVREERFNLTVSEAVTPFDFTLSTPSDITLTQGQVDPGRNITVRKTAGDAEEVTLSISGDTGGAIANFRTSPSCIPDSECQRNLAFNTSQATPSEYFVEIQGRATSGRTKVSNPFRLTINPSVVPSPSPTIPPSPPPPPPPAVKTECFFMDDQPITATSCSDEGAQAYITHPMVIPLTLTTAGRQTVFVRFISTDGQIRSFQRVINFAPDPRLTEISCSHSLSGAGSVVNITGTALGPRGKVKLAGDDATIITWNETDGTITASIDKRIEGKNEVEITRDDGKKAKGECIVGTTSVTFTAQSQCKSAGDFSAENVSVKIFANTPTTIETEKPDPIINEKIKVDKDGKPAGFVPKLEKDKKYSLIVKAPGTLAKRVDFETKGGTRNLDAVTLPAGDIAPAISADGKVNAFDRSELIRQWSLVRDVQRSGDFNQDGRINSIDYACMRQNINQSDEEFSPPALTASPPPVGVGTTEPVGVGTTSPPPVGGPSGVLPFRVSFDPNFATIALDGDMGTETSLTLDLTLIGGPGLKSVYVQFFEDGVWGPEPAQTASIELK